MVAGRLAFVTGAGSGIGRAVCRVLAREGATIIAADRNIQAANDTVAVLDGTKHLALDLNVGDQHSVNNAFKETKRHFLKPPNIVVNSAGITRDQFITKLNENQFDEVINVNLKGTFLVVQNAAKELIELEASEGSSIVNVGSIIGKIGNMGQASYCASKAGVEALTKTAAQEFGKFGIRVNTVLPGFIETPMTATVPDNLRNMFMKRVPLRRLGTPEEVAEVIAFLASRKSSYINGASIEVTGGFN